MDGCRDELEDKLFDLYALHRMDDDGGTPDVGRMRKFASGLRGNHVETKG